MRTLYLKRTTVEDINRNWGFNTPLCIGQTEFYVQCTKQGAVNWDKASVYNDNEINNSKRPIVII